MNIFLKKNKGFTVIELLVAASVFIIVMTIAIGMFVSATKAQRKIVSIQAAEENARFILEFLAKDIRVSEIQTLNGQNLQTLQIVRNSDGDTVDYMFAGGDIMRAVDGVTLPINGSDVAVNGFFDIRGVGLNDGQPLVTIVLDVERAGRPGEDARVRMQTTIAERGPDRTH